MKKIIFGIFLVLMLSNESLSKDVYVADRVQVHEMAKSGSSWDGSRLPPYPKESPEITILKIRIPPGARLPMHTHPVINAGVLLEGELTVIKEDGKILRIKAGEAIVEVVDKWHYGRNDGKVPAEIIVFYAGSPNQPITVKK